MSITIALVLAQAAQQVNPIDVLIVLGFTLLLILLACGLGGRSRARRAHHIFNEYHKIDD